jgi:PAS domain S-box-containing protein/putative nucleotidyltransferase with HDIG domain
MTTNDFTELYHHPELELIIELTGDNAVLEKIYHTKPVGIKVIDHVGARLFWDLLKLKGDRTARNILESTRDAFLVIDQAGLIIQNNSAAERMLKLPRLAAIPARQLIESIFGPEETRILAQTEDMVFNLTAFSGTEREFPAEVYCFPAEIDQNHCLVLSVRDVTERHKAQQEISRLHRYELLCDDVTRQFTVSTDINQSINYSLGAIGKTLRVARVHLWVHHPDQLTFHFKGAWHAPKVKPRAYRDSEIRSKLPCVWQSIQDAAVIVVNDAKNLPQLDRGFLRRIGTVSLLGVPITNQSSTARGYLFLEHTLPYHWSNAEIELISTIGNIVQNAMLKDEAQAALRESEGLYQAMITKSLTGIYLIQDGRLRFVNDKMAQIFGYSADEILQDLPFSHLIHPADLPLVTTNIDDRLAGRVKDISYIFRGVTKNGETIWLECMGSAVTLYGRSAIIGYLQDISDRIQIEKTRNLMFEAITMVAVNMAELRDPYTAGHQRRVAEIAVAVGRKMGLSDFELEGLRLSALLHDIGKIAVPIEILTKPGKLRSSEFQFIQLHSQVGADILTDVPFPWNISKDVKQHHERLDGSGYPDHLVEGQITLNARIIGVADVVEAMSSHRPYRPSLGMRAALDEVKSNRGRLYDTRVVDALLQVSDELKLMD